MLKTGGLSNDKKREMLLQALQKKTEVPDSPHPISLLQEGILFDSRLHPQSYQYNMPHVIRLRGNLNVLAFERSVNEIVKRHIPLQTLFPVPEEGSSLQVIKAFQYTKMPMVDLRTLPADEREAHAMRLANKEGQYLFKLAEEPLLRYHLVHLRENEYWFILIIHHLVFDLLSFDLFLEELSLFYKAFVASEEAPLKNLDFSYIHFARWQRQWLQRDILSSQAAYWQQKLSGTLPVLELPTDHPRPNIFSGKGALYSYALPSVQAESLQSIARQENNTLFMVLLAAFTVLLGRYTQQEDILIGTPIAKRDRAELKKMIGLFINTLVLRTDLSGNPTFRELLGRVKETALDAYDHSDIPFSKIVEIVQPERNTGTTPIFQVMFALESNSALLELPGIEASFVEIDRGASAFDLSLVVKEDIDGFSLTFEYSTDLFDEATIQRMAKHFECLLIHLVEYPDQPISQIAFLVEEEIQELLVTWNATEADYPLDESIPLLIQHHAAHSSHAIAAVCANEKITYGELNARSNQLAYYLQNLGVGPDVPVGICIERSLSMLVGMLAILKARGAYVPLDPIYPKDRLSFLIEDAQLPVILTSESLSSCFSTYEGTCICLDTDWPHISLQSTAPPPLMIDPTSLAYIIYTSGSTGIPKGVGVTHSNMHNFVHWHLRRYQVTAQDRATQLAGFGFDVSIQDIWPTLAAGASLYLPDNEVRLSPSKLRDWLVSNQITISFVPTPLTEELLALPWPEKVSLRFLITIGDTLHRYPRPDMPFILINEYGPTECTVASTAAMVPACLTSERPPSIGRPIANTQLYVLDRYLQLVPKGVTGELYIGGAGVARGYLHRPELTAERFIINPFNPNATDRLYKTGDLVRYLPDGQLEFLGRIDHQVKIRGFRIELGEIEATLLRCPFVREAVVIADEISPGNRQLIAYSVSDRRQVATDAELRNFLKQTLPDYMVPAIYIHLAALPINSSGKIDRKALPKAGALRSEGAILEVPKNNLERMIAAIWKDALGRDDISLHDNFFELGGHSLLMVKVHEQLCQKLNVDLPLVELFRYATVSALAQRLRQNQDEHVTNEAELPEQQEQSAIILDSDQHVGSDIAVIGMAVKLPGANTLEEFWKNLRDGVESITRFDRDELIEAGALPEEVDDPYFVPAKGVLEGADLFDAAFFGITPRDAEILDPQQRVFLECAWEALEHASYNSDRFAGRIGVYAGASFNTYLLNNVYLNQDYIKKVGKFQIFITNDKDFLTTRVAYKLNLSGPAVTVQTACSTSLVAVHMACQSLLNKECEMVLAGGVSIQAPLKEGYIYREGEIMSPDGHCRAFDAKAKGTVGGDGVGVVLLKRLSQALKDGDTIHAVIKGSAINNDGSLKAGYTAPSADGQEKVITKALISSGVHPDTISYIEAHGTGTPLGDPIEIEGLTKAFRKNGAQQNNYCAIGSVKTNIGHLDAAAGIAGLIKTILALQHRQLLPSLHLENSNPSIDFAHSSFFVNTKLTEWKVQHGPRRAGVSSFGVGGTNAHVIVEEAPVKEASGISREGKLLVLSARSSSALEALTDNLLRHLKQYPDSNPADIAYTLQVGRKEFAYRRILVYQNIEDAILGLEERDDQRIHTGRALEQRVVVFMFPGQGSQYVNMARELYTTEQLFREQVDQCSLFIEEALHLDLRDILFPTDERLEYAAAQLNETYLTQPALFAIEYALARLWMSWGVHPQAMIGHSIGEYVAACLAGVFSLEDALKLVAARGRLIQSCPKGAMLAVSLSEQAILPMLNEELSLAAVNGSSAVVIAGPSNALTALQNELDKKSIAYRSLHTSHAFHSTMVEAILGRFEEQFATLKLSRPKMPFISNVTGTWISAEDAVDPQYWARHLRSTVRFADGLRELLRDEESIFLEIGPGHTLSSFVKRHPSNNTRVPIVTSLSYKQHDMIAILNAVGLLWLAGGYIDWEGFAAYEKRHRVWLPTYPFERQRYWIEAPQTHTYRVLSHENTPSSTLSDSAEVFPTDKDPDVITEAAVLTNEIEELVVQIWQEVLGISPLSIDMNFFELGGDSLTASRVINKLREIFAFNLPLSSLFEDSTVKSLAKSIEDFLVEQVNVLNEEKEG